MPGQMGSSMRATRQRPFFQQFRIAAKWFRKGDEMRSYLMSTLDEMTANYIRNEEKVAERKSFLAPAKEERYIGLLNDSIRELLMNALKITLKSPNYTPLSCVNFSINLRG